MITRKLIIIAILILLPFIANAETVLKTGFMITSGKIDGYGFTLPSIELKLEQSFWSRFGFGFEIRKETSWRYSGYYLSLYPVYRAWLSKSLFIATSLGAEYGIASSEYDYYSASYDEAGNLIEQKWTYLVQNAPVPGDNLKGNTGIIYPFAQISSGIKIWKKLFVEAGAKFQIMKFGVKSCKFNSTGVAYEIHDEKIWKIIPALFIQLGYKF